MPVGGGGRTRLVKAGWSTGGVGRPELALSCCNIDARMIP
jgi:hypothetical protein